MPFRISADLYSYGPTTAQSGAGLPCGYINDPADDFRHLHDSKDIVIMESRQAPHMPEAESPHTNYYSLIRTMADSF